MLVLIYTPADHDVWVYPKSCLERIRAAFPGVEIVLAESRAEAEKHLPDADVIMAWSLKPDEFSLAKNLRWLHTPAAGAGGLMFDALCESPVLVTNSSGAASPIIADHVFAMLLALKRRIPLLAEAKRCAYWCRDEVWKKYLGMTELEGGTMFVAGFGSIGREVAKRARAFGMRVVGYRRAADARDELADAVASGDGWRAELTGADVVVNCLPLTDETRGFMSGQKFGVMKQGAVYISVGRGKTTVEAALVQALQSGGLGGAGLDVFDEEPLPKESPLWRLPNVIISPHVSAVSPSYWRRANEIFAENLAHFVAGEQMRNIVDKRAGY